MKPEIDPAVIAEYASLAGRSEVPGLIDDVVGDAPRLLDALRRGLAGDSAAVRFSVHTLGSTSAIVGARELSALCGEVERVIIETGSLAAVREKAAAIEARYRKVLLELAALREKYAT